MSVVCKCFSCTPPLCFFLQATSEVVAGCTSGSCYISRNFQAAIDLLKTKVKSLGKNDHVQKECIEMCQLRLQTHIDTEHKQITEFADSMKEQVTELADSMRDLREHVTELTDSMRDQKELMRDQKESMCDQKESMRDQKEFMRNLKEHVTELTDSMRDQKELIRDLKEQVAKFAGVLDKIEGH